MSQDRKTFHRRQVVGGALALSLTSKVRAEPQPTIALGRAASTTPFPHVWEACVGSDRASVAMRAAWQEDLSLAHRLAGFKSVRFHGLFDDDMGVVRGVGPDGPELSFFYVDQIFDKMLALGVRPFVELSFMPKLMASSDNTIFWYRGATAPPRRMSDWTKLIEGLAHHLIDRYGLAEVAGWRFECWNEPNLNFWAADQTAYFELYAATAKTLKRVDPRLQVGGPATAQLMWISEFLDYCATHAAPVDFVSAHSYADDPQENLFGRQMGCPREEVMPRAMARARAKIAASAFPHLPLVISEWSSQNPAFIAQMIRDCAPLCDTFSYWTFDNVFEEQGPIAGYDNSAYGLLGQGGVAKPSFHTFVLLHRLGDQKIDTGDAPILATRRADGGLAVLAWNLIPIKAERGTAGNPVAEMGREPMADGPAKTVTLSFDGAGDRPARIYRVDPSADPAERLYQAMGRPSSPTAAQFDQLRKASAPPEPEIVRLQNGRVQLEIPANGVALVEI